MLKLKIASSIGSQIDGSLLNSFCRWNIAEMWEKLRGKRLMFVGDSLNRGQWISMVCLLQSVIPADKKSMSPNAPLTIFRAEVNSNLFRLVFIL